MLVHIPKTKRRKTPDKIILAPELCHMTGLTKSMKSDFGFMRTMADATRIPAEQRHKMGSTLVSRLQDSIGFENNDQVPANIQKGKGLASGSRNRQILGENAVEKKLDQNTTIPLRLSSEPVRLTGRVLPAYKILLADQNADSQLVDPYNGFQSACSNASFLNKKPERINSWVITSQSKKLNDLFFQRLRNATANIGIFGKLLHEKPIDCIVNFRPDSHSNRNHNENLQVKAWRDALSNQIDVHQPDIILCILPTDFSDHPTAVYNAIKTLCCTQKAMLTQCVQAKNVLNARRVMNIAKNVAKQMLIKKGNTPWRVQMSLPDKKFDIDKATMVCGMDVNHDMRRNVSTVSFVASYSSDYTKYHTFVHHQAVGREVMIDGADLMLRALKAFKQRSKCLPKQIVVYRDGVSTGQLSKIVMHEVRAFKKAFRTVKLGDKYYDPKLSVIVTQKNVSSRFLAAGYKSLQPGTLIDTKVVSAQFWDFYIVPCEAPFKGTASPTRFIVVYDDICFTQADIAAFTNQLCMLFFNWAGPVRVPAPVQNAHKVAHMFGTAIEEKKILEELNGLPFYL
jgi:hypothetical protein